MRRPAKSIFGPKYPKAELGFYINSRGALPYRLKIRAPSFVNLSILPELLPVVWLVTCPRARQSGLRDGECDNELMRSLEG